MEDFVAYLEKLNFIWAAHHTVSQILNFHEFYN